mgnify:CR=1 FL=1|jgi:hypothetical protein
MKEKKSERKIILNHQIRGHDDKSEKIFEAISKMDTETLVDLIDEDINIDDDPCKYILLAEMKEKFGIFKSKGDTYLNQSDGRCLACYYDGTTKIFTGNNSGQQYSLRYTLKDTEVIELMQCNFYEEDYYKLKYK